MGNKAGRQSRRQAGRQMGDTTKDNVADKVPSFKVGDKGETQWETSFQGSRNSAHYMYKEGLSPSLSQLRLPTASPTLSSTLSPAVSPSASLSLSSTLTPTLFPIVSRTLSSGTLEPWNLRPCFHCVFYLVCDFVLHPAPTPQQQKAAGLQSLEARGWYSDFSLLSCVCAGFREPQNLVCQECLPGVVVSRCVVPTFVSHCEPALNPPCLPLCLPRVALVSRLSPGCFPLVSHLSPICLADVVSNCLPIVFLSL